MAFTQANGRVFVSTNVLTPNKAYTLADFEKERFVEIGDVGKVPESGTKENMVSYSTIDRAVSAKSKSTADAGDGTLEVAHNPIDPGQIVLRTHANTTFLYAFAHELANAPDSASTGTIRYNLCRIGGPFSPSGGNEDFVVDEYALSFTDQRQVEVLPKAGAAPTNTSVPTISGTAKVGQTLTVGAGVFSSVTPAVTYTYQWRVAGAAVSGATGTTYVPIAADVGKKVSCAVKATNRFGALEVVTAETATVVA